MGYHSVGNIHHITLGDGDTIFHAVRASEDLWVLFFKGVYPGEVGRKLEPDHPGLAYAMMSFKSIKSLDIFMEHLDVIRGDMIEVECAKNRLKDLENKQQLESEPCDSSG